MTNDLGINKGGRPPLLPILRAQIEEAQRHTNSNLQAARYLGVSYKRYKKYAELYGLFEQHSNVKGIGISKGFGKSPTSIPLKDILAGKYPKYSLAKLKNRLIARKKLIEVCSLCGFHERRITDNKVPLMLAFKDGNRAHLQLDNLHLLCYNCMFLTTGAPSVVYRGSIERSFTDPDTMQRYKQPDIIPADYYDPEEQQTHELIYTHLNDMQITEEERMQWLEEEE